MSRPTLPGRFVWFCVGITVVTTAKAMLGPLVPLYAVQLGASPVTVGVLISAAFWLPLLLALVVGARIDQVGPRAWLLWGTVTLAAAPLLVAALEQLWSLALAQVLIGLAQLGIVLASQTFVATLGEGSERLRFYGWYSTFQSGGQLVGPVLVGVVIDTFGFAAAFAVAGIIPALGLVALVPAMAGTRGAPRDVGMAGLHLRRYPGEVNALMGSVGVQLAMLMSTAVIFAMTFQATFLPVYLDELQFSAVLIGALFSLRAAASMVVRPFMVRIVAAHGNRSRTMVSMTLMLAVSIAAVGFVDAYAAIAIAVIVTGMGSGVSQPLSLVAVADHTPPARRGFAIGLRLTGNRLAQVASPIVLGLVAEAAGFTPAFALAGAALLVTAIAIVVRAPSFEAAERRIATDPT